MLDPKNAHLISLPYEELEAMLDRAAERGALRALHDVGLDGPSAAEEIRDLRSLLKALNMAKRTAWQTFVRMITTGILVALMAGIVIKLKLFGGQ
tara:strand:- start:487 stop:771 length:285 start_codon:yes stop_codon:yes gene_type:complete